MPSNLKYRLTAIAAFAFFAVGLGVSLPVLAATGWRSQQEKWWISSESLRTAIITLARVRSLLPQSSEATSDIADSTIALLVLFDEDDSAGSLDSLARLAAYDIGEAPSEVYECLVQRKGEIILGRLQTMMRSDSVDDCVSRHGRATAMCVENRKTNATHDRLESLARRIKMDAQCSIEH